MRSAARCGGRTLTLPELDPSLYGECQASLLNLEALLVSTFGAKYAIAEQLAVSLQFSTVVPPEKKRAARALAVNNARSVKDYIETFRGNLPAAVLSSMKYSYNVFLVPKVSNRASASDAAVEFIKVNEAREPLNNSPTSATIPHAFRDDDRCS